jgi:hypothetical protein
VKGEERLALAATLGAALALALAGLYVGDNPDTFGHLAQGRQIVELGHVPQVDSWSLLPGPPRAWHNYEWLSDLGTYLLYANAGYPAVTLFKCGLLALTVWWLARFAHELAGPRAALLTSLVVVSTIPAIRVRLSDRPHVLGICLAASYLYLLARLTRREVSQRTRFLLVGTLALLHVIWVNAHGSHLLGLAITGCFLLAGLRGQELRALLALLALELVACCISPYGPAIVLDAIDHLADPRYRALVSEWLPWRESDPAWLQLGPALHGALATILAPRLFRTVPRARGALLVALLLGVASFRSIRFVAEFMLLSAPALGTGLMLQVQPLSFRTFGRATGALCALLAPAVVLGAHALPPDVGLGLGISYAQLPRASGALLAEKGERPRVLAAMQDAWFTMFAAPNARFAVDGRVPFYGPDHVMRVSRAFGSQRGFDELVRELDVNTVIVSHTSVEDRALGRFARSREFSLVLIEDLHALYVRDDALTPSARMQLPPLRWLEPSYELTWLLAIPAEQYAQVQSELDRLAPFAGTDAFRGWVQGVLALAPLRRRGPADGFRWPRDDADWNAYRVALPHIERAAERLPWIPTLAALHAEIATTLCRYDVADRALERALADGASREPLLVSQELALHRGRVDEVRAVVERARALPEGRDDPWLAELERGMEARPGCP